MKILAIDLGLTRTGLAICDENEILATPVCVVQEKNKKKLIQKINFEVKKNAAELVVLGLPKNMDGTEGESAQKVKKFTEIFKKISGIPIVLWDERRTTIQASNILRNNNISNKNQKNIIDAVSAVLILESYLKFRSHKNIK